MESSLLVRRPSSRTRHARTILHVRAGVKIRLWGPILCSIRPASTTPFRHRLNVAGVRRIDLDGHLPGLTEAMFEGVLRFRRGDDGDGLDPCPGHVARR